MVNKKNFKILMVTAALAISQASTAFAGAWQADSVGWWYQNDDKSYPKSAWMQDTDGKWYYFDANGYMVANKWEWVDGNKDGIAECYLFSPSGAAYMNTATPDGYIVDANGAWIVNGTPQTKSVSVGPGGATTTTTKSVSFSGGGSGGSGGGGSSGGGGGSSYNKKDDTSKTDTTTKQVYQNSYSGAKMSVTDGTRSWLTDYGKSETDKKQEEILTNLGVYDMSSDFEKEMTIINYIIDNVRFGDSDYPNHMTSYGALIEGKAACAGFNAAFVEMCQKAGLDARMNWSDVCSHAWANVKLDGDWYIVDLTNRYTNTYPTDRINLTISQAKAHPDYSSHFRGAVNSEDDCTGTKYDARSVWYFNKDGSVRPTTIESKEEQFIEDVKEFISENSIDYFVDRQSDNQKAQAEAITSDIIEKGTDTYTVFSYSSDSTKDNNEDSSYNIDAVLDLVISQKGGLWVFPKANPTIIKGGANIYTPSGYNCVYTLYTIEYTAPEEDTTTNGEEAGDNDSGTECDGSKSGTAEGGSGSETGGSESGGSESGGYTEADSGEGGSNEIESNNLSLEDISENSEVIDAENFSVDDISEDIESDDVEIIENKLIEDAVNEQNSEEIV